MIYNIVYVLYSEGACDASNGSSFRAVTYEFDGTRPVLGNHDGNLKLNEQMDVQGFSHKSRQVFEKYHALHPTKPMFASECCSCESEREEAHASNGAGCAAGQSNASNGIAYQSGTMV